MTLDTRDTHISSPDNNKKGAQEILISRNCTNNAMSKCTRAAVSDVSDDVMSSCTMSTRDPAMFNRVAAKSGDERGVQCAGKKSV